MKLKFVGSRPIVTKGGVSFDETNPDKYTLLSPILDLLEGLESQERHQDSIDLSSMPIHIYRESKLVDAIKQQCNELDRIEKEREELANKRIDKFINNIKESGIYNRDDEEAFLANIDFMRDYYLHYVTNESVYYALLHILVDKICLLNFKTLTFPIGVNHGLVLSHAIPLFNEHRSYCEATISVEQVDGEAIGKLNISQSKK
jgi:hypothetical protein